MLDSYTASSIYTCPIDICTCPLLQVICSTVYVECIRVAILLCSKYRVSQIFAEIRHVQKFLTPTKIEVKPQLPFREVEKNIHMSFILHFEKNQQFKIYLTTILVWFVLIWYHAPLSSCRMVDLYSSV